VNLIYSITAQSENRKFPIGYTTAYSFHFYCREKDNEVSGIGNIMTAEFWEYDTRLGRRWNVDLKPNESISGYSCFGNNPMLLMDNLGDSVKIYWVSWGWGDSKLGHVFIVLTEEDVIQKEISDAQGASGSRYWVASGGNNNYIFPEPIPNPDGSGEAFDPRLYHDLNADLEDYKKEGRTVTVASYKLYPGVGAQLNEILFNLYSNSGSEDQYASYCGEKVFNILKKAHLEAKYTDLFATCQAEKMINNTVPVFANTDPEYLKSLGAASVEILGE
jgi:hypothetical protein